MKKTTYIRYNQRDALHFGDMLQVVWSKFKLITQV